MKEETESTYSVHTLKDTTPLRTTAPFVYDAPYEVHDSENNGQAPADDVATLDVSSPATQY